ncbi:class C sortase [Xylanimonas ulmi]|uniref:Sortase A n=1 Tax=Xylanimonas ulmi TaxID=228973 RepID=A0A4Q7M1I4_9MICO|nr:class C sortase [Xylanibacterium ulmi]RZS60432.1 sortase A [Xylanibacterium ulmi]
MGATLGAGILFFPAAAAWLSAWAHGAEVAGYVESVTRLPEQAKADALRRAREFNASLARASLDDPYAPGSTAPGADYLGQLDATQVMARVSIPAVGVDLPVYHGTSEQVLARGVGHLVGSSLPVGGAGAHAVLTGHSGRVEADIFDALHEVRLGDRFTISVLGEVLTYEVDQIRTVEPTDTASLLPIAGEDHVTLVTCTPIGVNSHRLLVRGVRVRGPDAPVDPTLTLPAAGRSPGFPWWALGVIAVPTAFAAGSRLRDEPAPRGLAGRHGGRRGRPAPPRHVGGGRGPRHGGAQGARPHASRLTAPRAVAPRHR